MLVAAHPRLREVQFECFVFLLVLFCNHIDLLQFAEVDYLVGVFSLLAIADDYETVETVLITNEFIVDVVFPLIYDDLRVKIEDLLLLLLFLGEQLAAEALAERLLQVL